MNSEKQPKEFGPVGIIGLGNMGYAYACNLKEAGFDVIGTDVVPELNKRIEELGCKAVNSAAEVAKASKYIITSLPSLTAAISVVEEITTNCIEGAIILETSTLDMETKKTLLDIATKGGVDIIDAPVSGTSIQAMVKDLCIYASGNSDAIKEFAPIFDGFARAYFDLGEFGNGTTMKFVANLLVTIHNVAAAEAMLFGVRSGLNADDIVKVIGDGAGSSRMFQVRAPMMATETWLPPGITNRVFAKDLHVIGEALEIVQTPAPLFNATLPLYKEAIEEHAEDDTAAVYAVLKKMCDESK